MFAQVFVILLSPTADLFIDISSFIFLFFYRTFLGLY